MLIEKVAYSISAMKKLLLIDPETKPEGESTRMRASEMRTLTAALPPCLRFMSNPIYIGHPTNDCGLQQRKLLLQS